MYTIRKNAALFISIVLLMIGVWLWMIDPPREKLVHYGFLVMSIPFLFIWLAQRGNKYNGSGPRTYKLKRKGLEFILLRSVMD